MIHYSVFCNVNPLPIFLQKHFTRLSVYSMNELQIFTPFSLRTSIFIRTVCINFGAEILLGCEIDLPVKEKC